MMDVMAAAMVVVMVVVIMTPYYYVFVAIGPSIIKFDFVFCSNLYTMAESQCNACFETNKMLIQPCPKCKGTTCRICINKYTRDHGYQCMICKQSIPRLKFFFAGKITEEREGKDRYWEELSTEEQASAELLGWNNGSWDKSGNNYPPEYSKPSFHNKIPVIDKSKGFLDEDEDIVEHLQYHKNAGWDGLLDDTTFVSLETYMNLEERIPWVKYKKYILTGPCCILDPNILSINHGVWIDAPCVNPKDFVEVLNQRNDGMINDCEVFSLHINNTSNCFCSIREWGMAKMSDKILLIYFDDSCNQKQEFYTFIQDCFNSLDKLDDNKKELVIYCHPELSEMFTSFQHYKQYLETIMKSKK